MQVDISFADLSHIGHFCNTTPYGVSLVAAYAQKIQGDKINPELSYKFLRLYSRWTARMAAKPVLSVWAWRCLWLSLAARLEYFLLGDL